MQTEFSRFINMVDKESACWIWTGTTYRGGYGHFRRKIMNKWIMYKAHRYSYEYYKGPIPPGLIVRHTCDNPSCVNPDHLLVGTQKDNINDKLTRGRHVFGNNPKHNLLSLEFARQVRHYSTNHPELLGIDLAEYFKTSTAQISRIRNNIIWREPEEL